MGGTSDGSAPITWDFGAVTGASNNTGFTAPMDASPGFGASTFSFGATAPR